MREFRPASFLLANGGPSKLSEPEARLLKQIKQLEQTIVVFERLPSTREVRRSVAQMHDAHRKLVERWEQFDGARRPH